MTEFKLRHRNDKDRTYEIKMGVFWEVGQPDAKGNPGRPVETKEPAVIVQFGEDSYKYKKRIYVLPASWPEFQKQVAAFRPE